MKLHTCLLKTILFCLLFITGCVNSNSPTKSADPINWDGTNAIFKTFEGKKEYSILFFYTDWCSYCHKMDDITFSDPTVANMMNSSFNCVRVNAESDTLLIHFDSTLTGRQMKTFYEITGYPTICIFKGIGQHIFTVVGFADPIDFAAGLNRVLDGDYD